MERNIIEHVTLALRPGEELELYGNMQKFTKYAVALVPTPAPPGEAHSVCKGVAVVCMQRYETIESPGFLWGWVHLSPDSKNAIGDLMLKLLCDKNRWYYLFVE